MPQPGAHSGTFPDRGGDHSTDSETSPRGTPWSYSKFGVKIPVFESVPTFSVITSTSRRRAVAKVPRTELRLLARLESTSLPRPQIALAFDTERQLISR